MKKKLLILLLITAMLMSMCMTTGSAKEIDTLAEIAALSTLKPLASEDNLHAYTEIAPVSANNLPSSYSSRDLGHTTPVRQQNANICWAFSSLSSLETFILKSGKTASHFSPEHMNIWGSMEDDGTGWQRQDLISDGGYSYIPMGYFTSWQGPLLETEFPIGSTKTEYIEANSKYSADYGVTGIKYVTKDTPIDTVKSYIMDSGAVVANFNADTSNYMNASAEAFYCADPTLPSSALQGHSISIVGWDDDYPKENFSTSYSQDTPVNNGAWLIKNSWGSRINNNGGYFWISYEDAWIFHSIFGPSFAISDYVEVDNSKKIYQNEVYGATTQFSYLTDDSYVPSDKITYINMYDFSGEHSVLDTVVFESTSFDADYTVYYIPVFGDKPTQETYLWEEIGSGTVDYTGYIPVDINDFELPEGKGAIGITIDNTRTYNENNKTDGYEYIPNSIGVCEWLAYSGGYYFTNQGEKGDSFVLYSRNGNAKLYDLMDWYLEYYNDDMGGTFVIKAITKNPDYVPEPTESQPATYPSESTTQGSEEPMNLSVTLEYLGDNALTIFATTTGGSGDYEYQFIVNDNVVQGYSPFNYVSLRFENDGLYTIQISVRDSNKKIIATQTEVSVKNGEVIHDNIITTEPTETTTTPASSQPVSPAKSYIMGDVDGSGEISIKDATLIRKHLAKLYEFDEVTMTLADVNASGSCNISDATLIQKYIALIDTGSEVGKAVSIN